MKASTPTTAAESSTTGFVPSAEQRRIIGHPLEPLRVAAGAGTGKTTTIVERLAGFVDAGLAPEAALGITFTNKAAEELADRLRRRLRSFAEDGREVEVSTYHGFAYGLLDELGAVVGMERGTAVIGHGYVRQLLHESVGEDDYDHLDLTFLAGRIDEAAGLGAQLAGNLRTPEDLIAAAPGRPDDVWGARLELARLLTGYRDAKTRLGVVDYGDLISLAHRLVTGHPPLAERVRRRYQLVVLDEYQDTDPGQRELLRAIFGEGFPITAVGDADQTIYEWRGASLTNFRSFGDHFPVAPGRPAATLPLTLNRRSDPAILALADDVRTALHGVPPEDPLRAAPHRDGDNPAVHPVSVGWFRTAEEEASWVAGEVRRLHDEDAVPWRDIGILFRKNRQMALVRDALHNEEVPLEVASLGGLLTVPEVADVHAWLRILERPEDSVALARVLLGSRYRLGLGDLAPLAAWVRRREGAAGDSTAPTEVLAHPMLEAIDRLTEVAGLDEEGRERLDDFRLLHRRLLTEAQGLTLVELVRRIIDGIDGWSEVEGMPRAHGLSARLNLYRFIDLVEEWSPLVGRPSLGGFLGYLDLLQDETAPDELDTARISGEDAVSLLTVHRAKGLEWDTVFVPAVSQDAFPARSQGFDDPLRSARWLPYEMRLDQEGLPPAHADDEERKAVLRTRHRAQELRTAYVAVTRAKRRLVVTGAAWAGGKRPRTQGEILETVRDATGVHVVAWVDDAGEQPTDSAVVAEPPDPHFAGGWRSALRSRLDDPGWTRHHAESGPSYAAERDQLVLELEGLPGPPPANAPDALVTASVTGLVTLAGCPKQYHWSEVDRLPRRPAPWLRKGTRIHRRIELHQRGIIAFDHIDEDTGVGESPPGDGVDAYTSYLSSRFASATPRHVETPIDFDFDGVRLRGRIDAVFEPEPGLWEIVDYKSGRPGDDPAALVQLQAYAVAAADGAILGGAPERIRVTFAYLGTDPVTERSIDVDETWLEAARLRLAGLAAAVSGPEFPAMPSMRCVRCDFARFCPAGRTWLENHPT